MKEIKWNKDDLTKKIKKGNKNEIIHLFNSFLRIECDEKMTKSEMVGLFEKHLAEKIESREILEFENEYATYSKYPKALEEMSVKQMLKLAKDKNVYEKKLEKMEERYLRKYISGLLSEEELENPKKTNKQISKQDWAEWKKEEKNILSNDELSTLYSMGYSKGITDKEGKKILYLDENKEAIKKLGFKIRIIDLIVLLLSIILSIISVSIFLKVNLDVFWVQMTLAWTLIIFGTYKMIYTIVLAWRRHKYVGDYFILYWVVSLIMMLLYVGGTIYFMCEDIEWVLDNKLELIIWTMIAFVANAIILLLNFNWTRKLKITKFIKPNDSNHLYYFFEK